MKALNFLANPVADALGWALLHAIWQGFALVLPTALVLHLLRNQSSSLRYRVSVLTLLAQVLLSAATFLWYYKPVVNAPLTASPALAARYAFQIRWQPVAQTLPWHQQLQQFLEAHLSQFVFVYLIGVALFGLRLAGGWVYLQRLSQTATPPTTIIWTHLTDKLRLALVIRAGIQVRESVQIAVPMVVGVLKPILLLPVGLATHLTTSEIEAVLAHELAHIKRHDYAVNLLQSVVEVLYFFHPAMWWLSARVREEREHCCDDLAVQVCGGDGRILAQALAHVEELRLTQMNQAPTLAMAFASKRQQLLHRVRRMLGVPTRPFVSTSSLAGLTLATILLMSVSVYAMQKQTEPKQRSTQPRPSHSTRRHSKGNGTEYGMIDNKKVDYVIWKGQKLSSKSVARLQRQLDQILSGKLSFNDVAPPDRDILLTIIETNQAFDNGMNSLAEGLTHIDYNTIIQTGLDAANAAGTFPVNADGVLKEVNKIDYNSVIDKAMKVASELTLPNDSLDRLRAYQKRQIDSLNQLIQQRAEQVRALQLQMEKMQFPVDESERNQQILEWRKQKLMEQRNVLIEKQRRVMYQDGKQKPNLEEIEKQVAALEPEIKKQEVKIEEVNQQLEATQTKIAEARQPLAKIQREAEQLDEQMNRLSEEMGRQGNHLSRLSGELSDLDLDTDVNVDTRLDRLNHIINPPHPPRPARVRVRTVPSVKPVIAPHPAVPAMPSVSAQPVRAPGPLILPRKTPPARVVKPRALPKPALAPKPDEKPE